MPNVRTDQAGTLNSVRPGLSILVLAMIVLFSTSCHSQKRLARESLVAFNPPPVLLLFPDFIFKTNNKPLDISGLETMTQDQLDSVRYYNSSFLQFVQDSQLVANLADALVYELQQYGFEVFTENELDSFFRIDRPAYVFSLAQAELEEGRETVTESDVFDDTLLYYKQFDLQLVRFNLWYEINPVNSGDEKPVVVFSSFFVQDRLKGRFWRHPLFLDVDYKYRLMEVRLDDVYGLASYAGGKSASYLFDHFFNQVHRSRVRSDSSHIYWHYNRLNNSIRPAGDNKFVPVGE